jgi:hypothetical protein
MRAVAERLDPSVLDTVIVDEPTAIAVIRPFTTVATAGLLDVHDTVLFKAFTGRTVAVNCEVCDWVKLTVVALSVIPDTKMDGLRIYSERVCPLILPSPVQLS